MLDQHLPEVALTAIVEAFQSFPGLSEEMRRQSCWRMLNEDLQLTLPWSEVGNTTTDIENLVRSAAAHWGGLESLMDGCNLDVEELEEYDEIGTLREEVSAWVPEALLRVEERTEVRRVLQRIPELTGTELNRMRRAVVPDRSIRPGPSTVLDVLRELDELPTISTPVPPLVVMLKLLLTHVPDPDRGRLHSLIARLVRRLGLDLGAVEEGAFADAVTRLRAKPLLIAQLDDREGDRMIRISLFLWYTATDSSRILYTDGRPRTAAEVAELLADHLRGHTELHDEDLAIEFAISERLVNWPFDQWSHGDSGLPLGMAYPMTVRIEGLQLNNDAASLRSRRTKANWHARHGAQPHRHQVYWDPTVSPSVMWAELTKREECVCVVLAKAPQPDDPASWEALRLALSAGAFTVVWSRTPELPADWEEQLVLRLRSGPTCNHVPTVHRVRIDAYGRNGGSRHPGRDLSLYRDDGLARRPPRGSTHRFGR